MDFLSYVPGDEEQGAGLDARQLKLVWQQLQTLGSSHEVLTQIVEHDPLGVRLRCVEALRSEALFLSLEQVVAYTFASLSRRLVRGPHSEYSNRRLNQQVLRSVRQQAKRELAGERGDDKMDPCDDIVVRLAETAAVGINDISHVCREVNKLPRVTRRAIYSLVIGNTTDRRIGLSEADSNSQYLESVLVARRALATIVEQRSETTQRLCLHALSRGPVAAPENELEYLLMELERETSSSLLRFTPPQAVKILSGSPGSIADRPTFLNSLEDKIISGYREELATILHSVNIDRLCYGRLSRQVFCTFDHNGIRRRPRILDMSLPKGEPLLPDPSAIASDRVARLVERLVSRGAGEPLGGVLLSAAAYALVPRARHKFAAACWMAFQYRMKSADRLICSSMPLVEHNDVAAAINELAFVKSRYLVVPESLELIRRAITVDPSQRNAQINRLIFGLHIHSRREMSSAASAIQELWPDSKGVKQFAAEVFVPRILAGEWSPTRESGPVLSWAMRSLAPSARTLLAPFAARQWGFLQSQATDPL